MKIVAVLVLLGILVTPLFARIAYHLIRVLTKGPDSVTSTTPQPQFSQQQIKSRRRLFFIAVVLYLVVFFGAIVWSLNVLTSGSSVPNREAIAVAISTFVMWALMIGFVVLLRRWVNKRIPVPKATAPSAELNAYSNRLFDWLAHNLARALLIFFAAVATITVLTIAVIFLLAGLLR